jgi:hypothetical protein
MYKHFTNKEFVKYLRENPKQITSFNLNNTREGFKWRLTKAVSTIICGEEYTMKIPRNRRTVENIARKRVKQKHLRDAAVNILMKDTNRKIAPYMEFM